MANRKRTGGDLKEPRLKTFFAILGIILLIAAVAAVGVLGYYSKGFQDWSFLKSEQVEPDQSDPTTPGGSTNPGDDSKEQWVTKTYQSEFVDLSDLSTIDGLQDYEQGFMVQVIDSDAVGAIFGVFSKERGETSKWYFALFIQEAGPVEDSGDGYIVEFHKRFQAFYYSENGYESVEFSLTDDIKILGIRRANSTEYTITYAVQQA